MPVRHQIKRRKGWRWPRGARSVTRATGFGNPFIVGKHGTRAECVAMHADLVERGQTTLINEDRFHLVEQEMCRDYTRANLHKLRGADTACFCRIDLPCHADTLMRIANQPKCEEIS